jgi:hypothetical protein
MNGTLAYVYAVARDLPALAASVADLPGVSGGPVRLVRAEPGDDVAALVSDVAAADFAEEPLKRHMEDLDWLETVARAHHGVVEAAAQGTTVLPLRLATVYLDDDRVRAMLAAHRDAFADRLDRLARHTEWGVKLYVEAPAREEQPAAAAGTGRDYLRMRRAQRGSREDAYRAAQGAAARVEEAARGHAVDRVRHRPQQGTLARGPGENIVNDAYLVPQREAEAFREDVTRAVAAQAQGVRVEITGPWVPYSFAAPPSEEPQQAPDGTTGP